MQSSIKNLKVNIFRRLRSLALKMNKKHTAALRSPTRCIWLSNGNITFFYNKPVTQARSTTEETQVSLKYTKMNFSDFPSTSYHVGWRAMKSSVNKRDKRETAA